MSQHAKEAMFDSMEQRLLETIGDFLDSESQKLDEAIACVKDPVKHEETELHIRMAKAAMDEYKKTVVYYGIDTAIPSPPKTEK